MAAVNSGSFSVLVVVDGNSLIRNNTTVTVNWSLLSQSKENKSSTISWTVTCVSDRTTQNVRGVRGKLKIDGVELLNGWATYISTETRTLGSGTTTFYHNEDGAKSFNMTLWGGVGVPRSDRYYNTVETTKTYELPQILQAATLSDASDFTDEDNPTIYYNNPSRNGLTALDACISFDGSKDDIAYRAVDKTGSSYTFQLTEAERIVLRKGITTGYSRTVKFYLRSQFEGAYHYSTLTRTLRLEGYEPTLNPTVKDTNTITINLTGSDQTFIRYYSNLYFNSSAQAHKNATISSQIIANGNQSFHDVSTGTFNKVESSLLKFTATDSRGFTVKQDVDLSMIPYTPVTARLTINRLTLQGELSFTLDGNYYNGPFGQTDNQLVIQYTLTKNGQPLREVTIDPTTDGTFEASSTEYKFEYTIPDLVIQEGDEYNTYSIQATVNDKLSSAETDIRSTTAMPIFDWSKADFKFNVPVHFSRGYTSDVNVKATSFVKSISVETAGNHLLCTRQDLEIHDSHFTSDSDIYNISGSMDYGGARYMIPSPNLSEDGTIMDSQVMKFWISGDNIYLVTNSAWGTSVPIRIIVQYI